MNEAELLANIGQVLIKALGTTTFVGSIEIVGGQRIANDFHPVNIRGQVIAEAPKDDEGQTFLSSPTAPPVNGGIPKDSTVRASVERINQRAKRAVKRQSDPSYLPVQFHRRERVARGTTSTPDDSDKSS